MRVTDRGVALAAVALAVALAATVGVGLLLGRGGDGGPGAAACDPADLTCVPAGRGAAPGPKASLPPTATPAEPATPDPPATPEAPPPPRGNLGPVAGPDTTGVTPGRSLSPHGGGELSDDGLVLEGVHVTGDLVLTGHGQRLRDVRVEGKLSLRGTDIVVEDSEVGSLSVSGGTGITVRRVEVFGLAGEDGIHVSSSRRRVQDVLIEGCWIHSPQVLPGSHYDGIQVRGVDRLTLRGNTFDLGPWIDRFNAAVFLEDANGGNDDVLVEDNWINGGGFAVYVFGTNVRLVDNRFGPDARWGLLYPDSVPFTASGNVWADDGSPADLD